MNYLDKILHVIDWLVFSVGIAGFFMMMGAIGAIDYSADHGVQPYSGSWRLFLISFIMVVIASIYVAIRTRSVDE